MDPRVKPAGDGKGSDSTRSNLALAWTRIRTIGDLYLLFPRILHPWPEKRFLVTIQAEPGPLAHAAICAGALSNDGPAIAPRIWLNASSSRSLVEFEPAIETVRRRHAKCADALHAWLDGLVPSFSDRIIAVVLPIAAATAQVAALAL
jgi:hypothetical protein